MSNSLIYVAINETENIPVAASFNLEELKTILDNILDSNKSIDEMEFSCFEPNVINFTTNFKGSYVYDIKNKGSKYQHRFNVFSTIFQKSN